MSFSDDLTSMFNGPFGVSCTAGSVTAMAILDEPTSTIIGDQVLFIDYVLHCSASDFGTLKGGDSITVQNAAGKDIGYTVRSNDKGLDGLTCEISLQKT